MNMEPKDIEHIAMCITLRERPKSAGELWDLRGRSKISSARLAIYWMRKAESDPELMGRIKSLYLEFYAKSGIPGERIDCTNADRTYSLEIPPLPPGHRARHAIERKMQEVHQKPTQEPSIGAMAVTFSRSMAKWARKGFKTVREEVFNKRMDVCRACDFWDANGMKGSGRCLKCGCATQAKLRLATEQCPIGKWGTED